MDNTIVKNDRPLKCGIAIKILSIIAFVCMVLATILDFITSTALLTFFLEQLLPISASTLFIIYIFKFYNKSKASFLVPFVAGILSISPILDELYYLDSSNYNFSLVELTTTVFFALVAINSLKEGLSNKVLLIIASLGGIMDMVGRFISFSGSLKYVFIWKDYYTSTRVLSLYIFIIGVITFYIAFLLFGLKNRIPAIITPKKKNVEKINPEQALKSLSKQLELGIITEEEYQKQRSDIISKL